MSSVVTKAIRKARKAHRCDGCDRPGKIQPGDPYLTHTALRGADIGYDDRGYPHQPKIPQRSKECADCANRYGRGAILNPVLPGQLTIDDAAA